MAAAEVQVSDPRAREGSDPCMDHRARDASVPSPEAARLLRLETCNLALSAFSTLLMDFW